MQVGEAGGRRNDAGSCRSERLGDIDSEGKEEKRAFGGEQKRESLCSGEI